MKTIFLLLVLAAGTISVNLEASGDDDLDMIRELVKKGLILPLESILALFPEKQYGKLLDLEVEREHGAIQYEIKFLRTDGNIVQIKVDARNGNVLEQEIED